MERESHKCEGRVVSRDSKLNSTQLHPSLLNSLFLFFLLPNLHFALFFFDSNLSHLISSINKHLNLSLSLFPWILFNQTR